MTKNMRNTLLAVLILVFTQPALALSLGKAHLQSSFGQPFKAEIELYNLKDLGEDDILIGLASNKAQQDMKVEPNAIHRGLKFKLEEKQGELILVVSSHFPIKEPFVEMVIQAKWPKGEIRRKYTFNLDLPTSQ